MTVLVLPRETFSSESKLAKILDFLGWKISHDPDADSDLVIWHNDDVPVHIGIKGSPPIVNWRTKLIDKARVNNVFENVFGYKIGVDPTTYHGLAVEKVLGHQQHGVVVTCPRHPNKERVYQKIITNHPDETWLEEFRIDVYGSSLLITRKQLDKDPNGFPGSGRMSRSFLFDYPLIKLGSMFEIDLVCEFLKQIGMEYGSLDVLRGLDDRLYIIDATTNTACPNPEWHGNVTEHQYIKRSAEYFKQAFSLKSNGFASR